jgi:DNA polymerase I
MMSPNQASKMLIVDAHAYAYRAFHAIRSLNSPTGEPTNAIFGFIKMTQKMQAQLKPSHVAVVWDGGLAAERMAEHPEYKIQRPPMPAHLEAQIDEIVAWLQAAGLASSCKDGVEADDWIASMARQAAEQMPVVIASSDKDFMQLVSERIGLLNPNDKSEKVWTTEDVRARTGVGPHQIIDWLALIGDSVDNIPGVPGVGPKTATEILTQFGSVDALYSRLAEVKSEKLRASLAAAMEIVRRNQRLISLRDDGPPPPLDSLKPRPLDKECLQSLYAKGGFRTLLTQLEPSVPIQAALL